MELTYDKDVLLEAIRLNRENHKKIYDEAVEGYFTASRKTLTDLLDQLDSDEFLDEEYVQLMKPVNHLKDYDRVISMLDNSIGNVITLNDTQYGQYVLDDWTWRQSFLASNSYYSMTAAQKANE